MINTQPYNHLNTSLPNKAIKIALLRIVCLFFILTIAAPISAQLKLYPLTKSYTSSSAPKIKSTARIKSDPPLTLPFWDDFSTFSLDSNGLATANKTLWINSQSVWINNGMGINEPSINVASFDGLDSANLPYNPTQIFVSGFTDKLISKPIDLGTTAVPPLNKDSVYLSFFYQWMGNGEAPDNNDFLLLEFKDQNAKWQEVKRMSPGDNPDRTLFIYSIVKVEAIYQHNAFQFRFKSYGRESGPFDTWNLDYIYLNKNRTANDNSFPDRAIASATSPLFGAYNAMPLNHFFDQKPLDSVTFNVHNLKDDGLIAVNYSATAKIKTYKDGSTSPTVTNDYMVKSNAITKAGGLIANFGTVKVALDTLPNLNNFDSFANEIQINIKWNLVKSGDLEDPLKPRFKNIDFRVNDTLTYFYTLKDYYAYDDGVAEYSVGLTQPGNMAAYEFNTLTLAKDTLTAFDVYFPDFAIASNLSTRFYIFDDAGGQPGATLRQPSVIIQKNGLNKFKRIAIPPTIVPLKFYVGWVETSANPVKVGLDMNHDTGDKIFVKVNGSWSPNTIIHGSLMIRPVFGKSGIITALPDEKKLSSFVLYPNPNSGVFSVHRNYVPVKIVNTAGQSVNYTVEDVGDEKRITLQTAPGLYIIQLQKDTTVVVRKIVVR